MGIGVDALLVVILERAAQGVGDEPRRDTVAQGDPDRTNTRRGCFERFEWKLQQRSSPGAQHIRWILHRRTVALLFHGENQQLVVLEGGPRQFDHLQSVEWNSERADTHLYSRGGFRGDASTDEILEGQAKNRQRLDRKSVV